MLPDIPGPADDTISTLTNGVAVAPPALNTYPAIDGSGNVIILGFSGHVIKYSAALSKQWDVVTGGIVNGASDNYYAIAADSTGNVYVVGDSYNSGTGADIAKTTKLLPTGVIDWAKTSTWATQTQAKGVAVGLNDSALVWGFTGGQLPGLPATNAGGDFELTYATDGTLSSLVQFAPANRFLSVSELQLDDARNIYLRLIDNSVIAKFDSSFKPLWQRSAANTNACAVTPDGNTAYIYQVTAVPGTHGIYTRALVEIDQSTGTSKTTRGFGTQMVTIDPVEGATWTGTFSSVITMVATSDAIYIAGVYTNEYMHGSNPKPTSEPGYIARLDLTGQQVWFRAYSAVSPRKLLTGPQNPLMLLGGDNTNAFIYRINPADGTGL